LVVGAPFVERELSEERKEFLEGQKKERKKIFGKRMGRLKENEFNEVVIFKGQSLIEQQLR
jgi:hypothetical protein